MKRSGKKFDIQGVLAENSTLRRLNPEFYGKPPIQTSDPIQPPLCNKDALKVPRSITFTIPGKPVGKPRMTRADAWKKRPAVLRYWDWSNKAKACLPKDADLSSVGIIKIRAYMAFPKTYSKNKRESLKGQPHLLRPDRGNITKGVEDSIFKNDSQLWKSDEEKRWEDGHGPRVEVELR